MSRKKGINELLSIHERRLQELKKQQALYGPSVDPAILIEIENIEAEVERQQAELEHLTETTDREEARPPCPYPGMVPFRAADARSFCGRRTEINRILRLLHFRRRLFVIGPSGSGKSSLIFAGVLPKLPESNYFRRQPCLVRSLRPGSQPNRMLARALERDLSHPVEQTTTELLDKYASSATHQLLLVIDQLEELFTQVKPVEQTVFISTLQALSSLENCKLLITVRADFYHDLMNSDLWPVEEGERLEIAPLRGDGLREAIRQPAKDMGVEVEEGLVQRIIADAADEPGVLPLVQETMVQLWEGMEDHQLSLDAYEALGSPEQSGLAGAIADRAEAILDGLSSDQQAIARRIFLRLVQFGEGRADTRRQQPVSELRAANDDPELFDQTLQELADNRLLTLSGKVGSSDRQVDIAHEALFKDWPTLRTWLSERRETERTRRQLEERARQWVDLGQGQGGLLDEIQLREAEEWLNSPDAADLGYRKELPALVQASRAAIEETEQKLAAFRQLATLGTAMSALQNRIYNTLNIIIPNITRLRRRVDPADEAVREILEIIERNVRYTSDYIQRIQDPLKETEVQLVDINSSLRDAQSQVRHQYQFQAESGPVEVVYNLDDSLPFIEASLGQITEIFRNLIENSYRAMGTDGGTLTITSRHADDWLEVEIQDTGPGFSPEIRDKLFAKPVPSSEPGQGAGLGLWLSALLLQKYAGEITMQHSGPVGTTMLVRLPVPNR